MSYKICPLMSRPIAESDYNEETVKYVGCQKEKCQWWCAGTKDCAIGAMITIVEQIGTRIGT